MKIPLFLIIIAVGFSSCENNKIYESYHDFETPLWHIDDTQRFGFTISDTTEVFNLKIHIRYSQRYPFHNLYYQYALKNENDSVLQKELKEIALFDPKSGKPKGSGLGDMFDISHEFSTQHRFENVGKYFVEFNQFMRMDSLPYILSVGMAVEKYKDEKTSN